MGKAAHKAMCYDAHINYGLILSRLQQETAYSRYSEKLKQE